MPGSGLFCDWRELDNKFEAFRLFQYADRELGLPVDRLPIDEAVRRALTSGVVSVDLDPRRHRAYQRHGIEPFRGRASDGRSRRRPAGPRDDSAPRGHGNGVRRKSCSAALGSKPSTAEIRQTVERFVDTCCANCRPGWEDACIESLGLVVRCLYPHLLASVSAAMEELSPALRGLFWHGVGRSLYFVPTNFLPIPGAHERMVKGAAAEASSLDDRRQVLAGLIWAVTLVNLPQPAVIRSLLAICSDLRIQAEFTNGLISALLAWRHMAPGDLRHIRKLHPASAGSATGMRLCGTSWIEMPAREALENIFPGWNAATISQRCIRTGRRKNCVN